MPLPKTSINLAELAVAQLPLEGKRVTILEGKFLQLVETIAPNCSRSRKCNKSSRKEKILLIRFDKKSKKYNNFKCNTTTRHLINRMKSKLNLKKE